MQAPLPPCRECGGALQRVESMPGHVVCGSGHLYVEDDVVSPSARRPAAAHSSHLTRLAGDRGPGVAGAR